MAEIENENLLQSVLDYLYNKLHSMLFGWNFTVEENWWALCCERTIFTTEQISLQTVCNAFPWKFPQRRVKNEKNYFHIIVETEIFIFIPKSKFKAIIICKIIQTFMNLFQKFTTLSQFSL